MTEAVRRLTRRQDLFLAGFGGASLLLFAVLTARFLRTGAFLSSAFLEKCLAKCAGLMSLQASALDALDILAVAALAALLLTALSGSLKEARAARAFSRSLGRTETPARLHRLLRESGLPGRRFIVFPGRLDFAFTVGLLRPQVYVSTSLLDSLSDRELAAVLRHEHGHLLRLDPLRGVVLRFFSGLFFFLPGAGRLLDRLRLELELLADQQALAQASEPEDLASAMVKTSRHNLVTAGGLARFGGDASLGERLGSLLDIVPPAEGSRPARRRFSLARLAAGAVLTLALSLLVIPAGAGFLKKSPWICPHQDHMTCCPQADPGISHSHCRT